MQLQMEEETWLLHTEWYKKQKLLLKGGSSCLKKVLAHKSSGKGYYCHTGIQHQMLRLCVQYQYLEAESIEKRCL